MPELRLKSDNTKAFVDELFGRGVKGIIGGFYGNSSRRRLGLGVKKILEGNINKSKTTRYL